MKKRKRMKKSIELTLRTIAIVILILIVLVFSILFFTSTFNKGAKELKVNNTKNIDDIAQDVINTARNY
jgi:Na+-transporting methylmalonyl-CoA/oxaloacetate decarboxylase gamma subunit